MAREYFSFGWHGCGTLFCIITLCSLLADSVNPSSKWVTSADRVFATLGTIVSPVRRCGGRRTRVTSLSGRCLTLRTARVAR